MLGLIGSRQAAQFPDQSTLLKHTTTMIPSDQQILLSRNLPIPKVTKTMRTMSRIKWRTRSNQKICLAR